MTIEVKRGFLLLFLIGGQLLYNILLASAIHRHESVTGQRGFSVCFVFPHSDGNILHVPGPGFGHPNPWYPVASSVSALTFLKLTSFQNQK